MPDRRGKLGNGTGPGRRVSRAPYALSLFIGLVVPFLASAQNTNLALRIVSVSPLPVATATGSYSMQFQAIGGIPPYTWSRVSPPVGGISLSPSGVLSGKPAFANLRTLLTIRVVDSSPEPSASATREFVLPVNAAPAILPDRLPGAVVGLNYSRSLTVTGGTLPGPIVIVGGTLPKGLKYSAGGVISGIPTASGQTQFTMRSEDANGVDAVRSYTLSVSPLLVLTTPSPLPSARIGTNYSLNFAVSGGVAPYVFDATGTLPGGFTLTSQGLLRAVPTTPGTFNLPVRVTDSQGNRTSKNYALRVDGQTLTFGEVTLPSPTAVGNAYGPVVFRASGGAAPYSFVLSAGELPQGITLSRAGVLGGLVRSDGTYAFSVTLTDGTAGSGAPAPITRTFSLTVNALLSILTQSPLPGGISGTGYRARISAVGGLPPYRFAISGLIPEGITIDPATGEINGTTQAAGNYAFNVQVSDSAGARTVRPFSLVIAASGGRATVNTVPDFLLFTVLQDGPAQSRLLDIFTNSATPVDFDLAAEMDRGSGWLSVQPGRARASSGSAASFVATVDPVRLPPGAYSGRIRVRGPDNSQDVVPVTMIVAGSSRSIVASPQGLTFRAVEGGAVPPAQSITIANGGVGLMSWTANAATLSGGPSWLTLSTGAGTSEAGSAASPRIHVTANPGGLDAGDYYGTVAVVSPGGANSPQTLTVVLSVGPATAASGLDIGPGGLVFVAPAGGQNPAPQAFTLTNLSRDPVDFYISRHTFDGVPWLSHSAVSGSVQPGLPVRIPVQPNIAGLSAGVRRGTLNIQMADGTVRGVDIALVTTAAGTARSASTLASSTPASSAIAQAKLASAGPRAVGACTPTQLVPLSTLLGSGFNIPAGWPTPVEVRVVDDCGVAMTQGSVVVSFSNGDAPLSLISLNDGRWSGTWVGRNALTPQVTVTVTAENSQTRLRGVYQTTGGIAVNTNPPVLASGGVVNAATFALRAPVAPGSLISIFGARLASTPVQALRLPLDTTLGVTSVTLGGRLLPLLYASDGQVNAVVPYGLPTDAPQSLLIRRGTSLSVPEPVVIASAEPGVFTKDATGRGQGVVVDSTYQYVEAGNEARAGDVLVIFSTGLGSVTPTVEAGTAAPASPLARTEEKVSAWIGGIEAKTLYSGLTPGFTGVYQVNIEVPAGIQSGLRVPVVIRAGDRVSPAVSIAVK